MSSIGKGDNVVEVKREFLSGACSHYSDRLRYHVAYIERRLSLHLGHRSEAFRAKTTTTTCWQRCFLNRYLVSPWLYNYIVTRGKNRIEFMSWWGIRWGILPFIDPGSYISTSRCCSQRLGACTSFGDHLLVSIRTEEHEHPALGAA